MDSYPPYDGPEANQVNTVALPFFALLGILITYLPCRSFWTHRNVPAVSIVTVTNIWNFMTILNAIIWSDDNWSSWWPGYGLCDVEALLRYPLSMALATSLCGLSKGLADCLDTDNAKVHQTAAMRRRKMIFDVMFCWAVPVLQMALHYIVQAGRYQIWPVFGCADVLDNSWPTIVIIMIWCPIYTFLNMYYAVLLLYRLRKHRRTISSALSTSGSGLAARKYLKLVIITFSLIVIYFPVQLVYFFDDLPRKLVPYSWSQIHDPVTWNPIQHLHTGDAPTYQYRGWASVVNSFLLWFYFGFNDNAVDTYRGWMVMLGFGHIRPSLKDSRQTRMAMRSRNGSSVSRFSLSSNLDLVGKVMKYFDGDVRKGSSTTQVDRHSDRTFSRKDSHGTLAELTRVATESSEPDYLRRKTSSPNSSNAPSSSITDVISPAPPAFFEPVSVVEPLQISEPAVTSSHRNFFSTFRTNLNVPFPLFGRSTPSRLHVGTQTQMQDLEAQYPTYPRRTSSIPSTTTQTSIWSGPGPVTPSIHTHVHANSHVSSTSPPIDQEDEDQLADLDPLAPKMGTRAYREREKHEMLRRKEDEARKEKERQKAASIIADDVKIEMAADTKGSDKGRERKLKELSL